MVTGYPPPHNPLTTGYPVGPAYPYAVPPTASYSNFQQEAGHTRFYRPPSATSSFLRRMLMATAIIVALVALIFFITWLVLKPRLPDFRVDSATVTSLNTTGTDLTARWDITLVIRNPNHKLAISYDTLDASVRYDEDLASSRLAPFLQETRSEARVRVQFAALNEYVNNDVAKGIAAERALGSVKFRVTVLALIRFKSGILHTRPHLLRVACHPVTIRFSPNNVTGTLMDPSRWCVV